MLSFLFDIMAPERVEFDPVRPETSMLWGLTTVMPTGKFIEVTPKSFPWLFPAHSDLLEECRLRGGLSRLHTYHHATKPLSLSDLLRLPHGKVDPAELAHRQRLTSYPGMIIKAVDWQNGPKVFRRNPVSGLSKAGQEFVAAHFTEDEKAANLATGWPAPAGVGEWVVDTAVNTYFAFHLIKLAEFPTPDQLIAYTEQRGIPLDLTLLQDGFISLVGKNTIRQLDGLQLAPASVEDFYSSAANWQKMLALKLVAQPRIKPTIISPYPILRRREQLPEISFIPYIGRAWRDFLLELPLYITEGGQYPLQDVFSAFRHLNISLERIICENIRDELGLKKDDQSPLDELVKRDRPQMWDEIVAVNRQLEALAPSFRKIQGTFKRFPQYLNGITSSQSGYLPDYQQFRQEILAATCPLIPAEKIMVP